MQLKKVIIENFRGLSKVEIDFDTTTVLIGENNTGKTSILEAIRMCLGRTLSQRGQSSFEEYDYHLPDKNSQPGQAGRIFLTFMFVENKPDEWSEEVTQSLGEDVVVFLNDLRAVILRVTSYFDETTKDFLTDWDFLDASWNPLPPKTKRLLSSLQRLCPVFYLAATRDVLKDFNPRAPFWAPFLRNPNIPHDVRAALEEELNTLNTKIIEAHKSLEEVSKNLKKAGHVIPLGEEQAVRIEALPGRAFDALSRAQVSMTCTTGAVLPLARHGAGMQSLSVMFLFESFLNEMLAQTYDSASEPILTLEEPEAHLHPCAVRTLWKSLQGMRGQKIIATHSGDLIAEVPYNSIRRLCRVNGKIEVRKINATSLQADDKRKLEFHIRYSRGELFFARCWLLVEGETEHHILNGLAKFLGEPYDLEKNAVRIVPARHVGIGVLLKVANDLGIAWHCLADGDSQGQSDAGAVRSALSGRPEEKHLTILSEDNIELFLCKNGFGEVYEQHLSRQKSNVVTAPKGSDEYWKQVLKAKDDTSKPALAIEVMERLERNTVSTPAQLKSVIEAAIILAKGQ